MNPPCCSPSLAVEAVLLGISALAWLYLMWMSHKNERR